jgi:hypothetical protein
VRLRPFQSTPQLQCRLDIGLGQWDGSLQHGTPRGVCHGRDFGQAVE